MTIELRELQSLTVPSIGFTLTFVKAVVGLSNSARSALRMYLLSIKRAGQAKMSNYAYKLKIMSRKQFEIHNVSLEARDILNKAKNILNVLNFGPEFSDEPEVQKLLNIILSLAQVKGISLGGYRDADNIVNAIYFMEQQAQKAFQFREIALRTLQAKLNKIDQYIKLLDAIDALE